MKRVYYRPPQCYCLHSLKKQTLQDQRGMATHKSETATEIERTAILRDVSIQTNGTISANRTIPEVRHDTIVKDVERKHAC